ncbi:MAG: S46 family peptidase [Ignavibacteria bacterium]|nr:S46 family peptidase [Ignavibacteria bacterium]
MITRLSLFLLLLALFVNFSLADEGMYPISDIHKLNLKAKGLKIDPNALYNPDGVSLIDAIVMVGGCTGSFVSSDGLILTNHHCAFGAAQAASTKENDYIANGFLAKTRAEEAQAIGYTVRITDSYRDVSREVLSAVTEGMDLAERTKAIDRKMKELAAEAEQQHPGKRAEVSEMFAGRTYVLFIYTYLRDVRMVYVPPRSIGEFGGETDNWIWPRHTGDFSFMRVYVAPDGSPADYSPTNVPYKPRKILKVQPAGVDEGDFVFLLGYPGRTNRHRTSHFMQYEEQYRMPYIANLYDWQIAVMKEMGEKDREVAIKHAARIKSLANVMKRFRGQLKGLDRLNLVEKKKLEEADLQRFIDSDPRRNEVYGTVLTEIGKVYEEITSRAESEIILDFLPSSSTMLSAAYRIYEASIERQKPDLERESAYMDRNFPRTKETMLRALADYHDETDRTFLRELLMQAGSLPMNQRVPAIGALLTTGNVERDIASFIDKAYPASKLNNEQYVLELLSTSKEELETINDPFLKLARALYPTYQALKETRQRREGALSKLSALLVDVKEQYLKTAFIPDANRTLRLTFGYIRGYNPADATYYSPITTLKGVIEKTTGEEPFDTPEKVINLANAKEYGRYKHPKLNDVPVAILYNTDTTGGNSGSPVINANGELVGVNFDRAWEATINDFAWSESYSRSIAVDIRYVLWVTEKVGEADHLLTEMGLK